MEVAYAFDKAGRLFTEDELVRESQDPHVALFKDAMREFEKMAAEGQSAWRDRVMRYRGLESLVGRTK